MQYKQPWKICYFHDIYAQLQKINLYSIFLLLSLLLFFLIKYYFELKLHSKLPILCMQEPKNNA